MCGIVGFLSKTGVMPVGVRLLEMLEALGDRGPDSAGVAIYGGNDAASDADELLILRVKVGEDGVVAASSTALLAAEVEARLSSLVTVREREIVGAYLRLVVEPEAPLSEITQAIETVEGTELVSAGHKLEIVKQVGTPDKLEATYGVSRMEGTHGIGHTRLSTESRIDLSHSQPFWAQDVPDLAIVHNGHITNYHKLRALYEEQGVRFHTENDSEVIGIYLSDRMARGDNLEAALQASMVELDGSFCYLAATATEMAFAKDSYSFKPLVVAETDEWIAIATEEIALRHALGDEFAAREPAAGQIQVWNVRDIAALTALVA